MVIDIVAFRVQYILSVHVNPQRSQHGQCLYSLVRACVVIVKYFEYH